MHVPEAAVDENSDPPYRQDYVRHPRQVATLEAEPETRREQGLPDGDLRLGVPPSDAGHHPAAGFPVYDIRQNAPLRTSGTWQKGGENGRENMASLHSGRFAHSEIILPLAVSWSLSFTSRAQMAT